MLVMYDSVDVSQIPGDAQAVAGYVGGDWPTFPDLEKHWPRAQRLSIAVNAAEDADCLDVEKGDATPADAPGWFQRQKARRVALPCFYGSVSVIPQIETILAAHGVTRSEYRVLSAHYTGQPHICGAVCGLQHPADGTQWTDAALGRNLDESLLRDAFFAKPDPLAALTPKERAAVERYDHLVKHPRLHPHELPQTRADLVRMRKETWLAAVRGVTPDQEHVQAGWDVHNRRQRYAILLSRTR
jgi:hypothetical protein